MNGQLSAESVARTSPSEDYWWIECVGCGGDVGTPLDWKETSVECPECGYSVQINRRVLYRPPVRSAPAQSPEPTRKDHPDRVHVPLPVRTAPDVPATTTTVASAIQKTQSVELGRQAERTLIWGIASIVLGWTFIVPICCFCSYSETSEVAKKERVPVPGKATTGLILSLLFGVVQGIGVIRHLAH